MTGEEFFKSLPPCTGDNDYDKAMKIRDGYVKEVKGR